MPGSFFPDEMTLLHNPGCSKSRAAKALLDGRGARYRERLYLNEPLTRDELVELRQRLARPAAEWTRNKEDAFEGAGLDARSGESELLDAIAKFPVLMERPILVTATRAVVGRPPENVLELIG